MTASGESDDLEIEIVRGRINDALADRVLQFWSDRGALDEATARQRLAEVVAVLIAGDETVLGVNSVHADRLALIGNRRFWIYRSLIDGSTGEESADRMFLEAFEALESEFTATGEGPIGIVIPVADQNLMRRRPEAVWPGTELMYAGYLADGRQARLRYFQGARI